jgi:hypothetical protein
MRPRQERKRMGVFVENGMSHGLISQITNYKYKRINQTLEGTITMATSTNTPFFTAPRSRKSGETVLNLIRNTVSVAADNELLSLHS